MTTIEERATYLASLGAPLPDSVCQQAARILLAAEREQVAA